jgi:predicted AAA+ superfamily ATPase
VASLARECHVERKTVAAYLEVLEDLLLSFRVPVFASRARRETVVHSKLFLFDAGVYRSLRPKGPLDHPDQIERAALEGLVAQHLRDWLDYQDRGGALHYWRTRSGVEVDFVVYDSAGFHAVEVKHTARIRPEDLRGLETFGADYPQATLTLLYRGTRPERRGACGYSRWGSFCSAFTRRRRFPRPVDSFRSAGREYQRNRSRRQDLKPEFGEGR